MVAAGAWAVELAEVDALPGAEEEFALVDDEGDGRACEDGFEVGVGVAFGVLVEGFALGDEGGELFGHVVFDVGVGVFVDGDGGGVWGTKTTQRPSLMPDLATSSATHGVMSRFRCECGWGVFR